MRKETRGRKKAQKAQRPKTDRQRRYPPVGLLGVLAAIVLPVAAHAQEHHHHDPVVTEPATTTSAHIPPDPPSHLMGPMTPAEMADVMAMDDAARFASIAVDRLEWREGSDTLGWEGSIWYGGDYNKLMLKSEGDWTDDKADHVRTELVWDRVIARWWSLQAGVRRDSGEGPSRTWAAVGIEGLAPYWIDLEATLYAGDEGRTALRVEASHDMRLTQRLILQPQLEFNAYGEDDVERGIGSGLSNLEAGLRLRYEICREFAPYVGVHWKRLFGATADFASDDSETEWVAGFRAWF